MNTVEVIKNLSVRSAQDFLNSSEDKGLSEVVADVIKRSDLTKVSSDMIDRIVNATNQMVNISILHKTSHATEIDKIPYFDIADSKKVKALLGGDSADMGRKSSSAHSDLKKESNSAVSRDYVLREEVVPMFIEPEKVETNIKEFVSNLLEENHRKVSSERNTSALEHIVEGDTLRRLSAALFGDDEVGNIEWAYTKCKEIFGRKYSEDMEENEKLMKKAYNANAHELNNIFSHLRIKLYKRSAEGVYDSEEFKNSLLKLSAVADAAANAAAHKVASAIKAGSAVGVPWVTQSLGLTGGQAAGILGVGAATNVMSNLSSGFLKPLAQYPGEASSYTLTKDWFNVADRIRAEDVAATTAIQSGVKEATSAGVKYGIGLFDKFIHKVKKNISNLTTRGDREKLLMDIMKESREIAINVDPEELAEWYSSLEKVAPSMSMDKSFVKGFLLQAVGIGQVTPDMLEKAARVEKSAAEVEEVGSMSMSLKI